MNRHDTHILSDSEEEEEKNEKTHKYSFNNSNNSNCSSEKISEHSNSKKNSPFRLEHLKTNNSNNNYPCNNNSLISIKDIEDIFYKEKNISTKSDHIDKDKKEDNINDKSNNNKKDDNINIKNNTNNSNNNINDVSKQEKKEKSKEKKKEEESKSKYNKKEKEESNESNNEINESLNSDSKNYDSKNNYNKNNDSINNESKNNDSKNIDSKINESKNNDIKNNDSKINDSKNDDSKINESINNDSKNADNKINDSKNSDSKINDSKINDSKINEEKKNNDSNNKEPFKIQKENIKIKLLKINIEENNNKKNNRLITYTPSLNDKSNISNYVKNRKCLSLNNSFHKSKKKLKKNKNNNIKSSIKSAKSKKVKKTSELKNLSNSNSNSNHYEEDSNMRKLINILKQKKIKALKVCKDSFSLNSNKNNPIILDEYPKFFRNHYKNERNYLNKIQHQHDFYLEQDNKYNIKQYKIPSFDFDICQKKRTQFFKQQSEHKMNINDNNNYYSSKYIINNNNNSQYCMSSLSRFSHNKKSKNGKSRLKLKNDKKIKILYDLYCGKPDPVVKSMNRIKSALSVRKRKTKKEMCKGMSEYNLMKNYNNYGNLKSQYLFDNKKSWLFKIIKLKKNNKRLCPYEKHFGSNESCPLCQEMDKKNEESLIKKGISPDTSAKKNDSKASLQKRRIYSATAKNFGTKNNSSKSDICGDFENEYNKTRNLQTNKSNFNGIMINDNHKLLNKKICYNNIKRKLKFNRDIHESNFSYSNNNN